MSTYKNLVGKDVNFLSTDPDNEQAEGQIWYNSTAGVFKDLIVGQVWSSAASSTNGGSSRIGFGIQTAGIAAGGATAPGNQTVVEEYNGSGWSTETALPSVRQDGGGAGTTTAGLVWCGEGSGNLNTTQEYNGSSWATTGTYPITARGVRGSGTQTAAISDGGNTPSPAASNVSAEYNGSTWTAGNNLPDNRVAAATSGPQTAALATTGKTAVPNPTVSNLNTSYDGTSWTAETVYPLSLRQAVSTGTSSAANLVAGGVGDAPFGSATTKANVWNGSSWTAVGDLGTKSTHGNGAGSSTASYINSGAQDYPSYPGVTQEFNTSLNVITGAAWSSGGNLNNSRRAGGIGSVGTQTSGLVFGGEPITGETEEYDGASWTTGGALTTSRRSMGACGTQTAGLASAGNTAAGDSPTANSEEYNGSSWSEGNNLNNSRHANSSAGIQTAAVTFGGTPSPHVLSEEYDGTSYTSGNPLNDTHWAVAGCGTQTAGIAVGGGPSTPAFSTAVEEYNGTSWTAVTSTPVGAGYAGIAGVQTSLILQVGAQSQPSLYNTTALGYDGTNWFTQPSIATGRFDLKGSGGTATAAYIAGGAASPGNTNATEEFTGETTALNIRTITTS